jgi:hypothetical protein
MPEDIVLNVTRLRVLRELVQHAVLRRPLTPAR